NTGSAAEINVHPCDLEDESQVEALFDELRPTHVVDLAIARPKNRDDQAPARARNTRRVRILAGAMERFRPERLVHAGSQYEYAEGPELLGEEFLGEPDTVYGQDKRHARWVLEAAAARSGTQFCCLRLFSLYGPGEAPSRFVPTALRRALKGETIFTTAPQVVHDFLYVDDAARAVGLALESDRVGVINIGSGIERSNLEVARLVVSLFGSNSTIEAGAFPGKERDRTRWRADIRRAKAWLRWTPEISLEDGLTRTLEFMRSHRERYDL
ncbi:MAG: NAD(P)-dependent oxidoreductase, partial [Myxococcota bacterium]